jgi:membrane associated rhomboid family serine protease
MDWSLVLASQGIETVIEDAGESGGWGLLVASPDCERALKALRQYRLENRNWPWRQSLPWPQTHFDWGSVAWAGLLIFFHWLSSVVPGFQVAGIMNSTAVLSGQWWRVFTAIMLHADVAHLATNLSIGVVLFGLAMGRYGTGTGLLAAYLAGIAGNILSLLLNAKPFYGLGASGMVMGALGLLAAQSLLPGEHKRKSMKHFVSGVAAGIMLFVLYGLSPGTDLAAHFGGFVAGLLFGLMLVHAPVRFSQSIKINLISGFLLVAMVVVTWRLALAKIG